MYKRHTGQVSMLDNPEFFGSLPLDPNNRWIKLSKQIPWHEFDLKYRENFKSKKDSLRVIPEWHWQRFSSSQPTRAYRTRISPR